jgi:glyoxylate reductase
VHERPRVFVSRVLPGGEADGSPIARIRAVAEADAWAHDHPPPTNELHARARDVDGVLTTLTERIDRAFLDGCSRLRVVANMAAGYDNIDVPACTERGIAVTNTPGVLADATADMAFALLLAAARRLPEGDCAIRNGEWGPWRPMWMLGEDVHGRTLGVIGAGSIGAAMARRAGGFEMRVLYCSRSDHPDFPGERVGLDELLAQSDFVSFHAPLTPETAGMCDEAFFRKMQPHAIFINTARGGVVDQPALIRALHEGVIGGAGLDVMTPEPLPPNDPLLDAPHVVLAPHVGSATAATRTKMAQLAVDGLLAGLAGEQPQYLVNPEALEHRRERTL